MVQRHKHLELLMPTMQIFDKIDVSKLTRDYQKFPLKKNLVYVERLKQKRWLFEEIPEQDLRYLYVECNLRQTDLQKYFGVSDTFLRPLFKKFNIEKSIDKIKKTNRETCLERYGDENFNNQEKYRQTCLKRYGKESTNQVESVKKKQNETCLKRYGHTKAYGNPEIQKRQRQTCLDRYGVESPMRLKEVSEKVRNTKKERYGDHYQKIVENKIYKNTIHSSKPEEKVFQFLKQKFPDVIHQYMDKDRYPYACDFYIPSLDLFIEYQGNWTHGGHPFNPNDKDDLNKVSIWKNKLQNSGKEREWQSFYFSALREWTKTDPAKRLIASKNNLNFLEFFSFHSFLTWFEKI